MTGLYWVPCAAEAQIVKAAAEEQEDSLAAHVLMSLLEGGTFNSDGEVEDPDYSPQVQNELHGRSSEHIFSCVCCPCVNLKQHLAGPSATLLPTHTVCSSLRCCNDCLSVPCLAKWVCHLFRAGYCASLLKHCHHLRHVCSCPVDSEQHLSSAHSWIKLVDGVSELRGVPIAIGSCCAAADVERHSPSLELRSTGSELSGVDTGCSTSHGDSKRCNLLSHAIALHQKAIL